MTELRPQGLWGHTPVPHLQCRPHLTASQGPGWAAWRHPGGQCPYRPGWPLASPSPGTREGRAAQAELQLGTSPEAPCATPGRFLDSESPQGKRHEPRARRGHGAVSACPAARPPLPGGVCGADTVSRTPPCGPHHKNPSGDSDRPGQTGVSRGTHSSIGVPTTFLDLDSGLLGYPLGSLAISLKKVFF